MGFMVIIYSSAWGTAGSISSAVCYLLSRKGAGGPLQLEPLAAKSARFMVFV